MASPKPPKQVKVHAHGCTPGNLELFLDRDGVVFVQADPQAPSVVHVDRGELFGTTTCAVAERADQATVYRPKAHGNFTLGPTAESVKQPGTQGTVQVLCLDFTGAKGGSATGSIVVNG